MHKFLLIFWILTGSLPFEVFAQTPEIPLGSPLDRFARWEGGPLELKRRQLLGRLPSDKSRLAQAIGQWYTPSTIAYLKQAGINGVWLTWSVGLSSAEEEKENASVKDYIQECHRAGIGVLALVSAGHLFCQPREASSNPRVLKDSKGIPISCPNAKTLSTDQLACYHSNLRHPSWKEDLGVRCLAALAAGADGIILDWISTNPYDKEPVLETINEIRRKVKAAKSMALVIPLSSRSSLEWMSQEPILLVEDGVWPRVRPSSVSLERGEIVVAGATRGPWIDLNLWLWRYVAALAQSRPVHLTYPSETAAGVNEETILPRGSLSLAIAESAAFGGSYVLSLDDNLRLGLFEKSPKALQEWGSAAHYQKFFADHSRYLGMSPLPDTAVVIENVEASAEILNLLSRRGLSYNVIRKPDFSRISLEPYHLVMSVNLNGLEKSVMEKLIEFAKAGGVAFTNARNFPEPSLLSSKKILEDSDSYTSYEIGKGKLVVYKETISDPDQFATEVRTFLAPNQRWLRMWNASTVFAHLTQSLDSKHRALHLVNYGIEPVEEFQIQVKGTFRTGSLMAADRPGAETLKLQNNEGFTEFTIPKLGIYALVTLD